MEIKGADHFKAMLEAFADVAKSDAKMVTQIRGQGTPLTRASQPPPPGLVKMQRSKTDRAKKLQEVNGPKKKGEKRNAKGAEGKAATYSGLTGDRPSPAMLPSLFENITEDDASQKEIEKQVEKRFPKDKQAQQRAFAFLEDALPASCPAAKNAGGAARDHRTAIAEKFVDADFAKVEKLGIDISKEEFAAFREQVMDEKRPDNGIMQGWGTLPPEQFTAMGNVVYETIREDYHHIELPADMGLAKALSTGTNRLRDFSQVTEQFKASMNVVKTMLKAEGLELPKKYQL